MNKFWIVSALSLLGWGVGAAAPAKWKVVGTVTDSLTQAPIPYATAALVDSFGVPVVATATEADGRFQLQPETRGNYQLEVTSVGYTPYRQSVQSEGAVTDVGRIVLSEGVAIDEVVVTVQKPLIVADAEKITYEVEADPEAATSTLSEIMRKIPQLSVDADGNVLLNGQSDYKVLVNGRSSSMLSKNFKTVIESMPAGSVKNIEVITSPSTKYEAEGVGGIINIVMNTRLRGGYNGSINAGYASKDKNYWENVYAAAQLGKLNLSVSQYFSHWGPREITSASERENLDNEELRWLRLDGRNKSRGNSTGFTIEASYEFDTLNLMTVELSSWFGNNRYGTDTYTEGIAADKTPVFSYDNLTENRFKYAWDIDATVSYQHTFNRKDHTLTFSYEVERDPDRSTYTSRIENAINYTPYNRKQWEDNFSFHNTVQADYFNPLTEVHQIEAGFKYVQSNQGSFSWTAFGDGTDWVVDPSYPHSDLKYSQQILGVYAGYAAKGKKFSGRVGVRIEDSWSTARVDQNDGKMRFAPNLFNVIPYVSASYRPDDRQTLSMAYTQRLRRPPLWWMNPYRDTTDPYNVTYGNPSLEASTFHNVSLAYRFFTTKWTFMLGANGYFSNNYIISYSFVDDQGVSNRTYGNVASSRTIGFNGSVGYNKGTRFNMQLNYQGRYENHRAREFGLENKGFNFSANLNLGVGMWKNSTLRLRGWLSNGNISLQTTLHNWDYYYSVGLRQQFFKEKLDLSVSVNNPFTKNDIDRKTGEGVGYRSFTRAVYPQRGVTASLGWRFGKTDVSVKNARRKSYDDEVGSNADAKSIAR